MRPCEWLKSWNSFNTTIRIKTFAKVELVELVELVNQGNWTRLHNPRIVVEDGVEDNFMINDSHT